MQRSRVEKRLSASFNAHDWCSPACLQLLVLFSVDNAIHNHLPPIMLPYSSFCSACYTLTGRVLRVTIIFNSKIRFRKDAFKQTSPEKINAHGNNIKIPSEEHQYQQYQSPFDFHLAESWLHSNR